MWPLECVAIGVRDAAELKRHLTSAFQPLVADGAVVRLDDERRGELHFLGCRLERPASGPDAAHAFRRVLARALAAWIVGPAERNLLRRLIATRYAYFDDQERESVLTLAERRLAGEAAGPPLPADRAAPPHVSEGTVTPGPNTGPGPRGASATPPLAARPGSRRRAGRGRRQAGVAAAPWPAVAVLPRSEAPPAARSPSGEVAHGMLRSPEARHASVLHHLGEYLEGHDTIVVDGFVTFRLKEYVDDLALAVDRAADDYLLDREYREFIGLLRHFVETRPHRPPVAECVVDPSGAFTLTDESGAPLGADVLDDLGASRSADVEPEDVLVSVLVTVAPERIRLHLPGTGPRGAPAALVDMLGPLREVFGAGLEVCGGCPRCAPGR